MEVSRKEAQWAFKISCLVMLLTLLPYMAGYVLSTKEKYFIGLSTANSADFNTYLAWMKQAQEGHMLFKIKYTTEPHPAVFFHPLFFLIGTLSRFTGFSLLFLSHLFRVLSGFLLLYASYRFIAFFLSSPAHRRTAFFLVCFSSGFGGFLLVGKIFFSFISFCAFHGNISSACFQATSLRVTGQMFHIAGGQLNENVPLDLWVPESVTLWSLYGMFLHPFSQALLLLGFLSFLRFAENGKFSSALSGSFYFFFLFLVHPYDALIVYSVTFVYSFLQLPHQRARDKIPSYVSGCVLIFFLSCLPVVYQVWVMKCNPVFSLWAKNPRLSPSLFNVLLGFGFPLLFSIYTVFLCKRSEIKETFLFLFTWCGLYFLLAYAPVPFQRRLVEGVHIPFCILAAYGMHAYFDRVHARRKNAGKNFNKTKAMRIVLILAAFTNICVFVTELKTFAATPFPYYLAQDMEQVFQFLDAKTKKDDVVLSSYTVGNFIPAHSGNTVYFGHYDQTLHAEKKARQVEIFYDDKTSCNSRRAFLKQNRIRYVFFSPEERFFYTAKKIACPFLREVFHKGNVAVFKVETGD